MCACMCVYVCMCVCVYVCVLPEVGPVAAQTMNKPLTSGRGACRVTNMYVVPQYCTPVTVKYSAAMAGGSIQ